MGLRETHLLRPHGRRAVPLVGKHFDVPESGFPTEEQFTACRPLARTCQAGGRRAPGARHHSRRARVCEQPGA